MHSRPPDMRHPTAAPRHAARATPSHVSQNTRYVRARQPPRARALKRSPPPPPPPRAPPAELLPAAVPPTGPEEAEPEAAEGATPSPALANLSEAEAAPETETEAEVGPLAAAAAPAAVPGVARSTVRRQRLGGRRPASWAALCCHWIASTSEPGARSRFRYAAKASTLDWCDAAGFSAPAPGPDPGPAPSVPSAPGPAAAAPAATEKEREEKESRPWSCREAKCASSHSEGDRRAGGVGGGNIAKRRRLYLRGERNEWAAINLAERTLLK